VEGRDAVKNSLVLSLFSGVGALDEGFRESGWCVVSAGDVAWSSLYDVRSFHPPAGVFDGVIGGDPCQSHSALANLVRAKGLEPSFPDMTPEFVRVVEEARPAWFLRENVPKAPDVKPAGYDVRTFLLDNWASLGEEQSRRRRFWFGVDREPYGVRWIRCPCCDGYWCRLHWEHASECPCLPVDADAPELRAFIDFALVLPDEAALSVDAGHDKIDGAEKIARRRQTVTADPRAVPVKRGGSGKVKRSAASCDGRQGHRTNEEKYRQRKQAATGRHEGAIGVTGGHAGNPPRYTLDEMLELQGLPKDLFEHSPLTMQGKRKFVGNAVSLPMARAIAKAVREATR
jgi:site-specific DNA-cytosine methylase